MCVKTDRFTHGARIPKVDTYGLLYSPCNGFPINLHRLAFAFVRGKYSHRRLYTPPPTLWHHQRKPPWQHTGGRKSLCVILKPPYLLTLFVPFMGSMLSLGALEPTAARVFSTPESYNVRCSGGFSTMDSSSGPTKGARIQGSGRGGGRGLLV